MAGKFRKKATQYRLTWAEDTDYGGLEVVMRSLSIEQFLEVTDMASAAAEDPKLQAANTRMIFSQFTSSLVEWNLTDEFGDDVPATLEGVMSQELDFIFMIFGEWQKRMGGVDDPLRSASSSGRQSLEASLPMEPSSPSRES